MLTEIDKKLVVRLAVIEKEATPGPWLIQHDDVWAPRAGVFRLTP